MFVATSNSITAGLDEEICFESSIFRVESSYNLRSNLLLKFYYMLDGIANIFQCSLNERKNNKSRIKIVSPNCQSMLGF